MNLLFNDSPFGRGVRTSLQSLIGFLVGLVLVVWNTPGVPQNVANYLQPYELQAFLWLGIPTVFGAGIIAYLLNHWREKQNPVVTEESPTVPVAETGTSTQ